MNNERFLFIGALLCLLVVALLIGYNAENYAVLQNTSFLSTSTSDNGEYIYTWTGYNWTGVVLLYLVVNFFLALVSLWQYNLSEEAWMFKNEKEVKRWINSVLFWTYFVGVNLGLILVINGSFRNWAFDVATAKTLSASMTLVYYDVYYVPAYVFFSLGLIAMFVYFTANYAVYHVKHPAIQTAAELAHRYNLYVQQFA